MPFNITNLTEFMEKFGDTHASELNNGCHIEGIGILLKTYGFPDDKNFWAWRQWYRSLTHDKQFKHVPDEMAMNFNLERVFQEFPHVCNSNKHLIAYTANPDAGRRDRVVSTKPGRYMARHTEDTKVVREMADIYNGHRHTEEIHFARTEDEIEEVYERGPNSCMKNMNHPPSTHPARVYGGPDTAVAYLENDDGIYARCVVRTDEEIFIRAYGTQNQLEEAKNTHTADTENSHKLTTMLKATGYVQDDLDGVRLLKIEDDDTGYLICPYLDGAINRVNVRDEYLVVSEYGDYTADNHERALLSSGDSWGCCNDCDENIRTEEDACYIEGDEVHVCVSCADNNYTNAYVYGSSHQMLVHNDNVIYCESDGEHYHDDSHCLEYHGIVQPEHWESYYQQDDCVWCEETSEWCHVDDTKESVSDGERYYKNDIITTMDGECYKDHAIEINDKYYWDDEDSLKDHGFVLDAYTGEYIKEDDAVELHDGDWTLKDNAGFCSVDEEWHILDDLIKLSSGDYVQADYKKWVHVNPFTSELFYSEDAPQSATAIPLNEFILRWIYETAPNALLPIKHPAHSIEKQQRSHLNHNHPHPFDHATAIHEELEQWT